MLWVVQLFARRRHSRDVISNLSVTFIAILVNTITITIITISYKFSRSYTYRHTKKMHKCEQDHFASCDLGCTLCFALTKCIQLMQSLDSTICDTTDGDTATRLTANLLLICTRESVYRTDLVDSIKWFLHIDKMWYIGVSYDCPPKDGFPL